MTTFKISNLIPVRFSKSNKNCSRCEGRHPCTQCKESYDELDSFLTTCRELQYQSQRVNVTPKKQLQMELAKFAGLFKKPSYQRYGDQDFVPSTI
ncbi:hypothetical protein K7432_007818 [Basidiobolus ranarum]|uniref:Uncharacterized protein n=1 Tax=Basidiobolus ranarum TaxID=34480 RepID=A0ABR2WSR2_9FUNG